MHISPFWGVTEWGWKMREQLHYGTSGLFAGAAKSGMKWGGSWRNGGKDKKEVTGMRQTVPNIRI